MRDRTRTRWTVRDRVSSRARRTVEAVRLTVTRPDALLAGFLAATAYLLGYLWAIDRLSFLSWSDGGFSSVVVERPLERAFERTGPFAFEPIALVDVGILRLLVSPIDVAIGSLLAVLVGLNLALAYLAIVRPAACGIADRTKTDASAGAGLVAAVPALLSGTACCAPTILLALGIGASGTLLTVLPWLLPIGIGLLLVALVVVADRVAPAG